MRKKENLEEKILEILKLQPDRYFNLSEIARSLGKSLPTIIFNVNELKKKDLIIYEDKRSMILIKNKGEIKDAKIRNNGFYQ